MKILALGALWVPYIRENWFDAIRHVLGNDVLCVNAGPLLTAREEYAGQPEGYHSAYVYGLLRQEAFDYLFFYHDWIFGEFPDVFFEKVRSAGVRTAAFHPDDEPERWYLRNTAYDHHFDVVASHSSAGVARRHAAGWGDRAVYLPWGYNQRSCYAIPDAEKRYDVVFVGKHKIINTLDQDHPEDGEQREQVLVQLAQASERKGWTFRLFGFGWEKHPVLKRYAGGVPSQEEYVRILNETRVVFNPAWSSDGDQNAVQTKLRHFEVPGCGAFQLTNINPELAELFVPGEELEFYQTDEELLDKVERFVTDKKARDAIARAGHARALREHTLDHRVRSLFERMSALYPPPSRPHPKRSNVKSLEVRDASSLTNLLSRLQADPSPLEGAEWVHFVGGDFQHVRTEYSVLEPFFQSAPDRILSARTFVDFEGLAANPLQPKLIEGEGRVLAEDIDVANDFDFGDFGPCDSRFIGVQAEGHARLLVNFIAPRERACELLEAFKTGSLEAVQRLGAVSTGRILTEVLLKTPEGCKLHRGRIRNVEYVRRLRTLLPRFHLFGWRVVLYGTRGMGETTLRLIEEVPDFHLAGIIDRSLDVTHFHGAPVLKPADLPHVRPDVLLLTAAASGASIHATIRQFEAMMCILPLYDLNHPVWRVVLP